MGLITVARDAGRARARMAVPRRSSATCSKRPRSCPTVAARIDEPRDVRRLRLRLDGADLSSPDLAAAARRVDGDVVEIRDPQALRAGAGRSGRRALSAARAVHRKRRAGDSWPRREGASRSVTGTRARAERLTRHVNAHARQEADRQPAVGARSAADQGRRLQRAHRALRRDGARARHSRAHRRRAGLGPRRVLLPRVARGVHRRRTRARPLAAGRSDASTSFPPTRRTCGWRAAASTSRRRSCR